MSFDKAKRVIRDKHNGYLKESRSISDNIEENQKERQRIEERIEEVDKILDDMKREKEEMYVLANKLDKINENLERNRIQEYLALIDNKKRLFFVNFLMGLAKGFGTVIGFTILAGIVLYLLQRMISLPIIGDFIAEIVKIVQQNLTSK